MYRKRNLFAIICEKQGEESIFIILRTVDGSIYRLRHKIPNTSRLYDPLTATFMIGSDADFFFANLPFFENNSIKGF